MRLWRCVMSDEEDIIPFEAERKLSYLLRPHQELQPKILAWVKDLLTEERKAWGEMRENDTLEERILFALANEVRTSDHL